VSHPIGHAQKTTSWHQILELELCELEWRKDFGIFWSGYTMALNQWRWLLARLTTVNPKYWSALLSRLIWFLFDWRVSFCDYDNAIVALWFQFSSIWMLEDQEEVMRRFE
jgi:hypothetical protein